MAFKITLSDLLSAVSEDASSDSEVAATVVHMVNNGIVRVSARLRDALLELEDLPLAAPRAA